MASKVLDREEYIEQAYFFRILRERLGTRQATQEILEHIHQEILATTQLPYAIQFLAGELKHSGQLSSGFQRLTHYFAPFQAFVIQGTEQDRLRFSIESGLLVLEREALYRAGQIVPAGLFIFQLEVISLNRLGYREGLFSMAADPLYDAIWKQFIDTVLTQLDVIDFADLLYLRSEQYVQDRQREKPGYIPSVPPLFGFKEGRIAKAHLGRDPLYLFASLQRQLGYPEVPRPVPRDDSNLRFAALQERLRQLETRLKLVEGEVRGKVDLSQFGRPDLFPELPEDDL